MKRMLWLAVMMSVVSLSGAQEHQHGAKPPGGVPPAPQPAPEMQKLTKMLAGTWRISEKVFANSMIPTSSTGRGSETVQPGPGGTSLIMDYQGSAMGPFRGHGIISWSPEKKVYESVWVDSMMPGGIMTMTGKWEGNDLVFTGTDASMGAPTESRHVYSNIAPGSFTYTLEIGPAGSGKLEKMMELQYKRTAGIVRGKPAKKPEVATAPK